MWSCTDNQDVGLEAATIQRVRNSSLVKWLWADNITGLKHRTEAVEVFRLRADYLVEEHSVGDEVRSKELVDSTEVTLPA